MDYGESQMDEIAKLKIAVDALKEIRENYGQVCEEFEFCRHIACQSSVSCWMTADKALKEIADE